VLRAWGPGWTERGQAAVESLEALPEGATVVTILHIKYGPSFVLGLSDDDRPTRWCFQCRKHLPHTWALMTDAPELHPTYYDSIAVLRCSRCHGDHTVHPGSYRDGPACPSEAVWERLSASARDTMQTDRWRVPYEAAMAAERARWEAERQEAPCR
jgi:hypothetical protein